jgi:hypothetical protein
MELREILLEEFDARDIATGITVEFEEGTLSENNNKIIIIKTYDEDYVMEASIGKYTRFEDWIGHSTKADLLPSGKKYKTDEYGKLKGSYIKCKINQEKLN